jgi:hypothetical protein
MIKRLIAFDFDGTLSNSPEPQEGMQIWKEKTGQDYPHKGWWGRPESLDTNIFDIQLFDGVLNLLKMEDKDPEAYVIILTSRREKLRPQLEKILADNKVHVDKVDMKTLEISKGQKILDYIKEFPDLREIDVFDDRESDIESYKQIQSQIPEKINFRIFCANNGQLHLVEGNNKLTNIINEELLNLFVT